MLNQHLFLTALLLAAPRGTDATILGMASSLKCVSNTWSEWSECSQPCGSDGVRTRTKRPFKMKLLSPGVWKRICALKKEEEPCNERECYKFALKGRSGNERVRITTGDSVRTVNLEDRWRTFETSEEDVLVEFTNEPTSDPGYGSRPVPERDVYFAWKKNFRAGSDATELGEGPFYLDMQDTWQCGTADEKVNKCNELRNGNFLEGGSYFFTFFTEPQQQPATPSPTAEPLPAPTP